MNFTTVVDEVVRITARPDLLLSIKREVNAAINFATIEGNFARDLVEDSVVVDSSQFVHSISLSTFPRWRKFGYIKSPLCKGYINQRDPAKVFENSKEARDVYYVTGDTVKISLCSTTPELYVGYFTYPPTLSESLVDYWLLDVSPYMIIHKAAAAIFSQVGNTTEATTHERAFGTMFTSCVRDYKYGANYG